MLATPKRLIASGLAIPPSTTALAAATLVSKSYLAWLPMSSSASLPTARNVWCHFLTASTGRPRAPAAASPPNPRPKRSHARSLADLS